MKIFDRARRLSALLARFRPLLAPYRVTAAGAFGCALGGIAMSLVAPWPMQVVIDGVLLEDRTRGVLPRLAAWLPASREQLLLAAVAAVLVIAILRGLFAHGQAILAATVGHYVVSDLRRGLFDQLQHLSIGFHARRRTGDLVVRLTGDVGMLRDVLLPSIVDVFQRMLVVVGMLAMMFALNPSLTGIALLTIPLLVVASLRFGNRIRVATREQRRREGKIAAVATESLNSLPVVQAFAREDAVVARFDQQNARSLRAGLHTLRLSETMARTTEIVLAASTALVLWLGAASAIRGEISTGELIVFLSYLRGMYKPVQKTTRMVSRFGKATACGERVFEVLDSADRLPLPEQPVDPGRLSGAIVFEDVHFSYPGRSEALSGVSFSLAPGETVGLVGASGSGKSTILSLLLRLHDPSSGRILVDGTDLRTLDPDRYRRQVGLVLQEPFLFGQTIADNLRFGRADATAEEMHAAARIAGADHFIDRLSAGYETVLGERGASLSRGQQQRVALARAVVREAPLLVFDEPTTGLDPRIERSIVRTLARVARDRTCLWIAHDLSQIEGCDRVLVVERGQIVEQGTPADLLRGRGAFARLFRGAS